MFRNTQNLISSLQIFKQTCPLIKSIFTLNITKLLWKLDVIFQAHVTWDPNTNHQNDYGCMKFHSSKKYLTVGLLIKWTTFGGKKGQNSYPFTSFHICQYNIEIVDNFASHVYTRIKSLPSKATRWPHRYLQPHREHKISGHFQNTSPHIIHKRWEIGVKKWRNFFSRSQPNFRPSSSDLRGNFF